MAHSPRGWTGARTPSAIKRVRQTERRHAINQPRRSAAKTLTGKAVATAASGNPEEAREALARAISALDRAAKLGAIHPNAASRRKSRLTLKVNAALEGIEVVTGTRQGRTTGKAAAAKEAKARIAAGKATKAKGAQTAAGKARAALAKTTREAGGTASAATATEAAPAAEAPKTRSRSTGSTSRSRTKSTAEGGESKPRSSRGTSKG